MMDKTLLHTAIKEAAEGYISKHKTESVSVATYKLENGEIVSGSPQVTNEIPSGDAGIKAIIDIIAEAVAQEVIKHIQDKMTLTAGTVSTATLPFTAPLNGAGGGVPGPVVIPGQPIVVAGGTMTIVEGSFK